MSPIALNTWEAMLQVNGGIYIKGDATAGSDTKGNLVFEPLASKVRKIAFDDGFNKQTTGLEILGCNNVGGSGTGGLGGDITIKAGYGYFGGGDIFLLSGTAGSVNTSGIVDISSANQLTRTGDVTIRTGEAFQYQSGNITLQPGKAVVVPGSIYLKSSLDSTNASVGEIHIEGYKLYFDSIITATTTHYIHRDNSTGKLSKSASSVSSSRLFKKNITNYEMDSELIYKLIPRSFEYLDDYTQSTAKDRVHGYIAEETIDLLPELVILDTQKNPIGIHYDKLVVPIIEEVKKQKEKIEYLEDKINKLMEIINGTK